MRVIQRVYWGGCAVFFSMFLVAIVLGCIYAVGFGVYNLGKAENAYGASKVSASSVHASALIFACSCPVSDLPRIVQQCN